MSGGMQITGGLSVYDVGMNIVAGGLTVSGEGLVVASGGMSVTSGTYNSDDICVCICMWP